MRQPEPAGPNTTSFCDLPEVSVLAVMIGPIAHRLRRGKVWRTGAPIDRAAELDWHQHQQVVLHQADTGTRSPD